MERHSIAFAKLAGIRKALQQLLDDEYSRRGELPQQDYAADEVQPLFERANEMVRELGFSKLRALYNDIPEYSAKPEKLTDNGARFTRGQLQRLAREVDQIFEIRSNSEFEFVAAAASNVPPRTVFITHGRAPDWRELQAFIERDVQLKTIELEQEPSGGMTVIAKLNAAAERCDSAVIVMTGDDQGTDGTVRTRENVMHEIGFFQGKLGLARVCLLHEEGVNMPSNLGGIVYVPFPRGLIRAAFSVLQRELAAIYR